MKTFNIKLIKMNVYLYSSDEKERFEKAYETKFRDDAAGCHNGNGIWCGQYDIETVAHEAAHCAIWIMRHRLCERDESVLEGELLPLLIGHITEKAMDYYTKEKK